MKKKLFQKVTNFLKPKVSVSNLLKPKLATLPDLPTETQQLVGEAQNLPELRGKIERVISSNESHQAETERQTQALRREEEIWKQQIKTGELTARQKDNVLRKIQRQRARLDRLERQLKIYQGNIDLHLQILDKIDEIEAMDLGAIQDEDQLQELVVDYEDKVENHQKMLETSRAAFGLKTPTQKEDDKEQQELRRLEAEILGEKAPAEPVSEKTSPVTTREPVSETNTSSKKLQSLVEELKEELLEEGDY